MSDEETTVSLTSTSALAVVGHVSAAPLVAAGSAPLIPECYRMGALIRLVCEHRSERRVVRLDTAHGLVELHGRLISIGDAQGTLAPTSLNLARTLVVARGGAVSRRDRDQARLPHRRGAAPKPHARLPRPTHRAWQ